MASSNFFTLLSTFSHSLESSATHSLAAAKQLKQRSQAKDGGLYAPKPIDDVEKRKQMQAQSQTWKEIIDNVAGLASDATALQNALAAQPSWDVDALNRALETMRTQSESMKQSMNELSIRAAELSSQRALSIFSCLSTPPKHSTSSGEATDDENNADLANLPVKTPSSSMKPPSSLPRSSRSRIALRSPIATPLKVSQVSPAKLAMAMRSAQKQTKTTARENQESKEDVEMILEEESTSCSILAQPNFTSTDESTSSLQLTQSPPARSPKLRPTSSSPTLRARTPAKSLARTPAKSPARPSTGGAGSSSALLDSPPTPDFARGALSEATRMLLQRSSEVAASSGVRALSSVSGIPRASLAPSTSSSSSSSSSARLSLGGSALLASVIQPPAAHLLDSPATPELATAVLARESLAARAARKAAGGAAGGVGAGTPATSRKTPAPAPGGNPRTPGPVTPARNLFAGVATPLTNSRVVHHMSASGKKVAHPPAATTPAAAASSSLSPASPEMLAPLQFGLLASSSNGGLDDSTSSANLSLNTSQLATPELSTRIKASSIAWISGANAPTAAAPPAITPKKAPGSAKKSAKKSQALATEHLTSPSMAASASSSAVIPSTPAASSSTADLPTATPRSAKKTKSSVRKSARLARTESIEEPIVAVPMATDVEPASDSETLLALVPAAPATPIAAASSTLDSAPQTPATPVLLSNLATSFGAAK